MQKFYKRVKLIMMIFLKSQGHEETYLTTFSIQSKYYLDLSKFLQNSCKRNQKVLKTLLSEYIEMRVHWPTCNPFLIYLKGLKLYYVQYILLIRMKFCHFKEPTKLLRGQNFRPSFLLLVDRLYTVIYKTQKTRTKVLPSATVGE